MKSGTFTNHKSIQQKRTSSKTSESQKHNKYESGTVNAKLCSKYSSNNPKLSPSSPHPKTKGKFYFPLK